VGLLAMSVRPRDLTAAVGVLRQELAVAERAGLVLWRLRALNELGTVEMMRDARGDRLCRAHELAVRVGALETAASILINLAGLHVMTDVIPEALAAAEQARQLAAPLGATQAVAAATAVEAVAHRLAGRRTEMGQRLRRAVELAPDDADIAAYATGGARGVVALLFEERAEALAAFARARELGTPIRAADPWHTGLLVRAVEGDAAVPEVKSSWRGPPSARASRPRGSATHTTADREWARSFWEALRQHSLGAGSYVNAMTEFGEDRVRAAYGPAKYERLAKIKGSTTERPRAALRPAAPVPGRGRRVVGRLRGRRVGGRTATDLRHPPHHGVRAHRSYGQDPSPRSGRG